jgi:hypothetical protein
MKKITLITVLAFALVFSTFSVFADTEQSVLSKVTGLSDDAISELRTQRIGYGQLIPASILAGALDMDIKDVLALRQAGKSYYQIAADKGIDAEDFKNDLLEKKNVFVDEQVKAGNLTAEQGKLVKERMNTNIESCNGLTPGAGRIGGGCGMGGFAKGRGFGRNSQ